MNINFSVLPCSMNGSAANSSLALWYYWAECFTNAAGDSAAEGTPSAGLLIFFITYCFEFFVGAPSNLWLICHILSKR